MNSGRIEGIPEVFGGNNRRTNYEGRTGLTCLDLSRFSRGTIHAGLTLPSTRFRLLRLMDLSVTGLSVEPR